MEYEISDEEGLFDPSTNPSQAGRLPRKASPGQARRAGGQPARAKQKGEVIPEEDSAA